jgi:alpha-1,2-mannosyltransferase
MSRTARLLALIGLAVLTTTFAVGFSARRGLFDLRVYHGAINYWVHEHGMIYDFGLSSSHYGFTYPPFAALLMLPMAVLGQQATIVVATTVSALATVAVLVALVAPTARRHGWKIWYAVAVAGAFAVALDPVRETFAFGQVNLLLVALVAGDLLLGVARGRRWAGVGIGLATAVKLTPGVFIVYLLVTRRFRAALVAAGTTAAATLLAAAVDPRLSRFYWMSALWDTDRIGDRSYVSNQSLAGAVARLGDGTAGTVLWLAVVALAVAVWAVRVRRAVAAGDEFAGLALTGVLGCLVSPVTWVHHLVWAAPALVLLGLRGLEEARTRRRAALLGLAGASYLILCSRLVWALDDRFGAPLPWFLSNAYVWVCVALLVWLPVRRLEGVADLGDLHRPRGVGGGRAVGDEAVPLVEPPRPRVALQHP